MPRLLVYGELEVGPVLSRLGELGMNVEAIVATTPYEVVREGIARSDFVFANNVDLDPFLPDLAKCRLTVVAATGYDWIDIERARALSVPIANLVGYSTEACVEYIISAILDSLRPIRQGAEQAAGGDWSKARLDGRELHGMTIGIIGCGRIGSRLASVLSAISVRLLVHTRSQRHLPNVICTDLHTLMAQSSVVVVCCSLNASSRELLDRDALALMREDAVVVSISPNAVFDLEAFADAMHGRAGARAVLDLDPILPDHPLLRQPNVQITPHIAFKTNETLDRRIHTAVDVLQTFLSGGDVTWISPRLRRDVRPEPPAVSDELLEIASSFYYAQALYSFIRSGLAEILRDGPVKAADAAARAQMPFDGVDLLLRAGASAGYLTATEDGFLLTPRFAPLLDREGGCYVGDAIRSVIMSSYLPWRGLPRFVRTGKRIRPLQKLRGSSSRWASILTRGSDQMARSFAPMICAALADRKVEQILDIGCGSAAITRRVLRQHEEARAVLVDTERVLRMAETRFIEPDLLGRCDLRPFDFMGPAPLPGGNDVVLLANVLHMLDHPATSTLLQRAVNAAAEQGTVLATSCFLDPMPTAFSTHFALSCALHTGGRGYTIDEMREMFRAAALRNIRVLNLGKHWRAILGEVL